MSALRNMQNRIVQARVQPPVNVQRRVEHRVAERGGAIANGVSVVLVQAVGNIQIQIVGITVGRLLQAAAQHH